jgi:PAS domain S-box-containing protein
VTESAPLRTGDEGPLVSFCGYCAARGQTADAETEASRVCPECSMGLLLETAEAAAPTATDPFVVVDRGLAVRAVSRSAERLLGISETTAIDRHVADLLEPADEDLDRSRGLHAAIGAATGSATVGELAVRPRGSFGVRWWARIAPCAPGPAALVVLVERI